MTWTTTPYTTLSLVKEALDLTDSGGVSTDYLNNSIIRAQSWLDEKIGYTHQEDVGGVRYYRGSNLPSMMINDCQSFSSVIESIPITSVVSGVYVLGSPLTTDITADCLLYPFNRLPGYKLMRQSGNVFTHSEGKTYTVTGTWGYPAIPNEIIWACTRMAVHFYWMQKTAYADQLMENGAVKMRYTKKIPEDVQQIIDKKRKNLFRSR